MGVCVVSGEGSFLFKVVEGVQSKVCGGVWTRRLSPSVLESVSESFGNEAHDPGELPSGVWVLYALEVGCRLWKEELGVVGELADVGGENVSFFVEESFRVGAMSASCLPADIGGDCALDVCSRSGAVPERE
jgi:hypothetical protein